MERTEFLAITAFRPHLDALARSGYFPIVHHRVDRWKAQLHFGYRILVWALVLTYNLQHVINVIQARHSTRQVVDILFILLTTLNTLGKQLTFNLRGKRIDQVLQLIDGKFFAQTHAAHGYVMHRSAVSMRRLLRLYHAAIFLCGTLWTVFPLVNRASGGPVEFTGYFPFDTEHSPNFELALAYMSILITWQAYGNVTQDCTIVAFYAQAQVQLRNLRYNLRHLVDNTVNNNQRVLINNGEGYIDDDKSVHQELRTRMANSVKHYHKISWYVKEIESIFGEAMLVQFFVMAWVICMTTYKIVGLAFLSAEFVSMAVYLVCMLAQLYIYCYYGTQLHHESLLVETSIFAANWTLLSPRFRRDLLLVMQFCSKPIAPRTAYVIPMSLKTYIAVLRFSYTLYTILDRK